MVEYSVEIIGDQVFFTLSSCTDLIVDSYISNDEFLSIVKIGQKSSGWLGYGGMMLYFCSNDLPIVIFTPHYEYMQDLIDVQNRIEKNMKELINGNILS